MQKISPTTSSPTQLQSADGPLAKLHRHSWLDGLGFLGVRDVCFFMKRVCMRPF